MNGLSRQLEAELESFLRDEPTLKELQLKRRQKAIEDKLAEDKPLNELLQSLMEDNPILSKLFLLGQNLPAPFPPGGSGKAGGNSGTAVKFAGKRYPEYFRFKDRKDNEGLQRRAPLGQRIRVTFETDAEDAYFVRDHEPGCWNVRRKVDGVWGDTGGWNTTGPKSGVAHLTLEPPDGVQRGDVLEYAIEVTDRSRRRRLYDATHA